MQASIQISRDPSVQYLLRVADTCLILAQRLSEWCGHAPILEEDIALTNMSLDLIGQTRALLTHVGQMAGQSLTEDQLAFLRDEKDYVNPTLCELPRGDFAATVVRNVAVAVYLKLLWAKLQSSSDAEVAAIAGKAIKEATYHLQHFGDWMVRLGDGTDESHSRMQKAVDRLWPYTAELFVADEVDAHAASTGLGPACDSLKAAWLAQMGDLLQQATLTQPADTAFRTTGKRGIHSEHMGYILTEMQYLQRAYPGGVW